MSAASRPYRRRIGEILVNDGIVSQEQIDEALALQKKSGELLGVILMDMGIVTESDIAKTLCLQYQLPFICLANYDFDEKLVQLLPKEFMHRNRLLPFDKVGEMLLVMVAEIPPDNVLAEIPKKAHLNAALYVGYFSEVEKHLDRLAPLDEASRKSAAGAASVAESAATITAVEDDGASEDSEQDSSPESGDGEEIVFGGAKQTFLEELDSTWDSIFEEAPAPAKSEGKPRK